MVIFSSKNINICIFFSIMHHGGTTITLYNVKVAANINIDVIFIARAFDNDFFISASNTSIYSSSSKLCSFAFFF